MKLIPLTKGLFAIVDDCDYEYLCQWNWQAVTGRGKTYAMRSQRQHPLPRRSIRMHNVILGVRGVDHRNGDTLDNRRENLRECSVSQNQWNKKRQSNKLLPKGVTKQKNKYRARITVEGNHIHLGYYDDPILAAWAYDKAAVEHFGEFALLNFPDSIH